MDDLLPIGSVILAKNANKKIFIVGYGTRDENGNYFDYVGFPYPEGFLSPETIFAFNQSDIEKLYFRGYSDKEFDESKEKFKEILRKNREV